MTGAGARVSWRLALRLVRRAPARSALIAALIAIPVLAGTFALVTISTARLSADEAATRFLGRADAFAQVTQYAALNPRLSLVGRGPEFDGQPITSEMPIGNQHQDSATVDLSKLLPPGA